MPEMQDLDQSVVFMEPVIDLDGRMEDFPDARAFRDGRSDSRKILKKVNMV